MDFYGMDTEQGESFAQVLSARRGTLEERAAQLDGVIQGVDSFWRGTDAETFRSDWGQLNGSQIAAALDQLMELARELAEHAQEQDITSADGAMGAIGERLRDIFSFDGGWENPLAAFGDWKNWATSAMGALTSGGDEMLSQAWRIFAHGGEDAIVPWLRTAYGLKAAGKVLGPVGNALTGVLAGVDRWNEDAGDPSLSDGERAVRAGVDGGANIAGAAAGAWAGAKGGALAGAAIGSIFPGPGTAIGGVVGGIVGAVGAGIIGGGVADSIVDWALG